MWTWHMLQQALNLLYLQASTQEYRQLVEDPALLHFFAQRIIMYVATGINLVLLAC
jgi:hypothetical protein